VRNRLRIGVDSYSYHRLLGEVRPGERDPGRRLADGGRAVIEELRPLGLDAVSLQTSYLPADARTVEELRAAAAPMELTLAWGAPNGVELGRNAGALDDLLEWIELAAHIQLRLIRIVAGGPSFRERATEWPNAVPLLRRAAAHAQEHRVTLALENHGDLTVEQLSALLDAVDHEALQVCFDSANAARVGDDVLAAAARLASRIRMVHLKDIEPVENAASVVAGPCSVPFGEGIVPLLELVRLVAGSVAQPTLFVELGQLRPDTDERELLAQCVDWLRRDAADVLSAAAVEGPAQ
jgi:sugar phosphate isomerase/epimerase